MSETPWQQYETPLEKPIGVSKWIDSKENTLFPQNIESILKNPDNWDSEKWKQEEEYQKFIDFISIPENTQYKEFITSVFENISSSEDIVDYIYENGYIVNQNTFQSFEKKFWGKQLERQEKEEEVIEKKEEVIEQKEETNEAFRKSGEKFLTVFESRKASFQNIPELTTLVEDARTWIKEEKFDKFDWFENKVRNILSQNSNLEKIASSLKTSGDEKWYQEFKTYVSTLDTGFASRFEKFEANYGKPLSTKDDLATAQIVAGLWVEKDGDFKKYGNIVEANKNGQTTRMDIGEVPPRRFIGLPESNYSLETDVPVGDFYSAVATEGLAYEKTAKENGENVNYLDKLSGTDVRDFINSDDFSSPWMTLQNAVLHISRMIGLPAEKRLEDVCGKTFTSKDDLKNFVFSGIVAQKETLQKEIDEKKKAYQDALKAKMTDYKKLMENKDKETKQVLEMLRSLGLDMLWGSLDLIISQVKAGMIQLDLGEMTFDRQHIDLANGDFGESRVSDNSMALRKNLVAFANKLYFWNVEWKDEKGETIWFDVSAYTRSEWSIPETKTFGELQGILNNPEKGIVWALGMVDIEKVKKRLGAKAVDTKSPENKG